jgi:hypothetical protein
VDHGGQALPPMIKCKVKKGGIMASKEQKLAVALAEATESHWFNPASMARILSDQPIYTLDQIMELVKWIIHYQDQRYNSERLNNRTSNGLMLAHHLKSEIERVQGNLTGALYRIDPNAKIDLI